MYLKSFVILLLTGLVAAFLLSISAFFLFTSMKIANPKPKEVIIKVVVTPSPTATPSATPTSALKKLPLKPLATFTPTATISPKPAVK